MRKRSPRLLSLLSALVITCVVAMLSVVSTAQASDTSGHFRVLVYSQTLGYRHDSIPDGIAAIEKLGADNGFGVDATEDPSAFTDQNLSQYKAVIWLSTTGDVLNSDQRAAFQRYIEAGGGFVGIHAGGTDTECAPAGCPAGDGDWPWFRGLVGGVRFVGHPGVQPATVVMDDNTQPSTRDLPGRWTHTDEWYNWNTNPRAKVHVLATVDEHTYSGGTMGADHPISWCLDYDGGRSWYTALGHTTQDYTDPLFLNHILGGIRTAARVVPADCSLPQPYPEGNPPVAPPVQSNMTLKFQQVAQMPASQPTTPPTDQRLVRYDRINYIGEVPDGSGRMYVPDLNGNLYFLKNGVPHVYLDLKSQFPDFFDSSGLGSGFGFVAFDPDFAHNGRFYTVHTEAGAALTKKPDLPEPAHTTIQSVIEEWTATNPSADTFSGTHREVMRLGYAGSAHDVQEISFNPTARPGDPDYGLLYIASGDGAAGATGNTPQDLTIPQGKLLRIDPLGNNSASGRYGVPASNPFVHTPRALGEIYSYGYRDPHRFSWDPVTHQLFLGHIGEHDVESVDNVQAGDNDGWSVRQGPFMFIKPDDCHVYPLPAGDKNYGFSYPVAAYTHMPPPGQNCNADVGHAIIGGFVYRGTALPALYGKYVFADNVTGRIFYTNVDEMQHGTSHLATIHQVNLEDANGNPVTIQDLLSTGGQGDPNRIDLRFGIDSSGELYVVSKGNGRVYKIVGAHG